MKPNILSIVMFYSAQTSNYLFRRKQTNNDLKNNYFYIKFKIDKNVIYLNEYFIFEKYFVLILLILIFIA